MDISGLDPRIADRLSQAGIATTEELIAWLRDNPSGIGRVMVATPQEFVRQHS